MIDGNIWICTVGSGLHVFSTNFKHIASWGMEVYTVLYVKESESVIALTPQGLFVFNSDIICAYRPGVLVPKASIYNETGSLTLTMGVVIQDIGTHGRTKTEVWLCSRREPVFKILHPPDFQTMDSVYCDKECPRIVRLMQTIEVKDKLALIVANLNIIELWDVEQRQIKETFNVMEPCKELYHNGDKCKIYFVCHILYRCAR